MVYLHRVLQLQEYLTVNNKSLDAFLLFNLSSFAVSMIYWMEDISENKLRQQFAMLMARWNSSWWYAYSRLTKLLSGVSMYPCGNQHEVKIIFSSLEIQEDLSHCGYGIISGKLHKLFPGSLTIFILYIDI